MNLQGKKVLVFGTGKSGISAANLLWRSGAVPVLYDGNEKADKEAVLKKLDRNTEILLGNFPYGSADEYDLLVMSPGVPCDIPEVESFKEKKNPVWGEIELAYRTGKGKILAVTGTNGKTTTTSLLGEIMQAYYPEVYVVGNIGNPYTDISKDQSEAAWTVAEISSFQLETIVDFHPAASAITNITEDHLNRHHTMEEYIRVKERIAENQTEEDLCVLNYEDEILRDFGKDLRTQVMFFSSRRVLDEGISIDNGMIRVAGKNGIIDIIRTDELKLLGLHNYENYMTAIAMALHAGVPLESIRDTCRNFAGVEHRIEYVCEINGVRYYNDSKGTNPDAAIKAVEAMDRPTLLIAGGYDKQSSYEEWIGHFGSKVRFLTLIGQTRDKIREAAVRCGFPEDHIRFCDDLREAVNLCAEEAHAGEAVLLSPACASWGQFDNYEQRGDLFKKFVKEIGAEKQ